MEKVEVKTKNAPEALGPYSQAIKVGSMMFISGQIALDPKTNKIDNKDFESQVRKVFENLNAICEYSGANINNIVKLNLFLTDLSKFDIVNEIMMDYFEKPYPARATVEVSGLPKGVNFEADAIVAL